MTCDAEEQADSVVGTEVHTLAHVAYSEAYLHQEVVPIVDEAQVLQGVSIQLSVHAAMPCTAM